MIEGKSLMDLALFDPARFRDPAGVRAAEDRGPDAE
jgi:hypothetical protein